MRKRNATIDHEEVLEINCRTFIREDYPCVPAPNLIDEALPLAIEALRTNSNVSGRVYTVVAVHWQKRRVVTSFVDTDALDAPSVVSVGRHECVELSLPEDSSLSLRHLAVILSRDSEGEAIVRVLDLNSGSGIYDCFDNPVKSLISHGPVALRVGGTALFVARVETLLGITRPRQIAWAPIEPWIPIIQPEKLLRQRRLENDYDRTLLELSRPSRSCSFGESACLQSEPSDSAWLGRLSLEGEHGKTGMQVDDVLSRVGVLIGRYDRCDLRPPCPNHGDSCISRVHALFVALESELWLFDVGSTNGLWTTKGMQAAVRMGQSESLQVKMGECWLKWTPHGLEEMKGGQET